MSMVNRKESELEDAPAAVYRSAVWDQFAFRVTCNDGGKKVVDKSVKVCKHLATHVVYANSQLICKDIIPVRQLAVPRGKGES